ncbi:hypothetical protein, partial [Mycobacteroides abscessus]|uniref:hypothetical protein n=1 Tax=Mycobacteroides abscessus TaxID=36809 RepID=UPI00104235E9
LRPTGRTKADSMPEKQKEALGDVAILGHAKALDARLHELGASPLLGRVDGEATDRTLVASWTADLLDAIGDGATAIVETVRKLRSEG